MLAPDRQARTREARRVSESVFAAYRVPYIVDSAGGSFPHGGKVTHFSFSWAGPRKPSSRPMWESLPELVSEIGPI